MLHIRPIQMGDNKVIASIIRTSLEEHGVALPGTVYTDPTTDDLYTLFGNPLSSYWIAEFDGVVVGGAGVFPTLGLPEGYAELVKLYVLKHYRGKRIGEALMNRCFISAKELGYHSMYLETLPELGKAITLYQRMGFKLLTNPLGDSGHFSCSIWAEKRI